MLSYRAQPSEPSGDVGACCKMGLMAIHITGDDAADQVLTDSPFALLVGMMLDQRMR